jgi:undecaprenyl diphosphate synthase
MDKELLLEVYGRVQGVGFRRATRKKANEIGLSGWIKNKEDGGVELVAQGNRTKLKELISWIEESKGLLNVDGVSYHFSEISNVLEEFEIKTEDSFFVDQFKAFSNLGRKLVGLNRKTEVPRHVAIIPDGNRRWARSKGLQASFGHYKAGSVDNVFSLLDEAQDLGIRYFSLWGFSSENWKRDSKEVDAILNLLSRMIKQLRKKAKDDEIRFRHIGRKDRLPKGLAKDLKDFEKETRYNEGLNVQLFFDYGGRDELIRAVNDLIKKGDKVSEEDFSSSLDTVGIPDPDLIIRTSGEKRLSGFMPFQSVYAELYFSDKMFPDFKAEDLRKAVGSFGGRERRFGGS